MAAVPARRIVMLGTDERTRGGIASVVGVLRRQGLFERCAVRYVATHADGSRWHKLLVAAGALGRVAALLLRGEAALLHIHTASGPSFWRKSAFVALAQAARVPYVLHVHGGGFDDFYRRRCGAGSRAWVRHALRGAHAVVALSEQWRTTLQAIEPAARIAVIANPVEIPPRAAPLDRGAPTVLFLGLIAAAKGLGELAEAWPAVRAALPQARLVLAGSGDETERWRAAFDPASVRFAGWVDAETRAALLHEAWLFVLPSHREALPMAVLEAMAAGVPVVATDTGGVALAVRDGETGVLIAPRDAEALRRAMIELLGDAARRRRYGEAARRRAVELFSADAQAAALEGLWREALADSLGRRLPGSRPSGIAR